jgi:hypothetical protein
MRTMRYVLLVGLLAAFAVIPASHTQAKGQVSKVTVSGPRLKGVVEVTDTALLAGLSLGELESFGKPLDTLPALGEGYEIARYLQEPGQKPFLFDRVHYFPSLTDETGYIYFDGLEGNAWSDYDGNWYRATTKGDAAVRSLLAKLVPSKADESLAKAQLEQAPTSCKDTAKLEKTAAGDQEGVKINDGLWVGGFQGSTAALTLDGDSGKRADHGWAADLDWLSRSNNRLLTIWGRNMDDDSQLWFSLDEQPPSAVLSFNPSLLKPKADWSEFQAKVFVPKAGCYEFSVYMQHQKTPTRFTIAAGS